MGRRDWSTWGRILLVAVWLSGWQSLGTKVDETLLPTFERGKTSFYDVQAACGKPTKVELRADGTRQWVYQYTQTQPKWQSFIPLLDAFEGGQTAETSQTV